MVIKKILILIYISHIMHFRYKQKKLNLSMLRFYFILNFINTQ